MNFFHTNFFKRTLTFLLGLSTLAGLYSFEPAAFNLLFIAVFLWISIFELSQLFSTKTVWYWLALFFYLGLPLALLFNLYKNPITQTLALWTFALTLVHDAAAYCIGKLFGKHLLAPTLSPKKTWQGCFGGFLMLLLFMSCTTHFTFPLLLFITLTLSVLCITGDLFESWLKRNAGIKDSGALLPGHGGLLDRIDAALFVIPFVYYYQELFLKALL
jgi:phosphatidate cytidylyltransferase